MRRTLSFLCPTGVGGRVSKSLTQGKEAAQQAIIPNKESQRTLGTEDPSSRMPHDVRMLRLYRVAAVDTAHRIIQRGNARRFRADPSFNLPSR